MQQSPPSQLHCWAQQLELQPLQSRLMLQSPLLARPHMSWQQRGCRLGVGLQCQVPRMLCSCCEAAVQRLVVLPPAELLAGLQRGCRAGMMSQCQVPGLLCS